MTQHAINCRELRKTYAGKPPVEALRGIDLEVVEGECFGVLGPNGAGKTTAIEIMEGLLPPTAGSVEILGRTWEKDGQAIRENLGVSLQETMFSDRLTVLETLTLFRSFYRQGLTPQEALARVSLEEKADAWIKHLSGGQKQRLAVAVAIVGDPKVLFLDEPTTGLDPQSRRQLWQIIESFGEQGRTVLLTTHYMEEAERLCRRVAIIDHGQIIALGTPRELIASIGGEHVIEFALESNGELVADAPRAPVGAWEELPGVTSWTREDRRYLLTVTEPHVVIPSVLGRVEQAGQRLASLSTRHASLDDVFVKLTGRRIGAAD
jgi:ABC-2 type transport system ATP-binding protein